MAFERRLEEGEKEAFNLGCGIGYSVLKLIWTARESTDCEIVIWMGADWLVAASVGG